MTNYPPITTLSPEEEACEQHFRETTTYDNKTKHFTVRLPFRTSDRPKNNYFRALRILHSVERGLSTSSLKARLAHDAMKKYFDAGHARLVEQPDIESQDQYFFSWHGVQRAHELETKMRIVFNASLDAPGGALNTMVYPGRSLIPRIDLIITRFRNGPWAVSSDVKSMFLEVNMHEDDLKYLQFLYRPPGSNEPIRVYRKTCAAFGITSSPFHAQAVVQKAIDMAPSEWEETKALLRKSIYVDNCQYACASEEEAAVHAQRSREIFKLCGMTLLTSEKRGKLHPQPIQGRLDSMDALWKDPELTASIG